MKQFGRQLHNQAKSVKLRAVERAELKDRLQMYMEYHPLPQSEAAAATKTSPAALPRRILTTTVQKWFTPVAGVTATFLILILPVIAEQAVPGDLLYPMKVQINEEVRSTLTFSSQDKIKWETTRIERRLAEARLLESQGKLTDELEQAVAAAVRTHARNTETEIAALREVDAEEAAVAEVSFASSLAVQSEALVQTSRDRAVNTPASPVLLAVQSEEREANARSADSAPSYERMLALIEQETTTATELFKSIKNSIPAAEVARIERRFDELQVTIDTAIAQHTELATLSEMATTTFTDSAGAARAASTSATTSLPDISTTTTATSTQPTTTSQSAATQSVDKAEFVSTSEPTTTDEVTTATSSDTKAAAKELRAVLEDVKRLIRFMSDITVRESVSLDDWLPIALSTEERVTDLEALLAEMKQIQKFVDENKLSAATSSDVLEQQQALVRNILAIEELLRADDIEGAEGKVQIAYQKAQALRDEVGTYVETRTVADATTTAASTTTANNSISGDTTESN